MAARWLSLSRGMQRRTTWAESLIYTVYMRPYVGPFSLFRFYIRLCGAFGKSAHPCTRRRFSWNFSTSDLYAIYTLILFVSCSICSHGSIGLEKLLVNGTCATFCSGLRPAICHGFDRILETCLVFSCGVILRRNHKSISLSFSSSSSALASINIISRYDISLLYFIGDI